MNPNRISVLVCAVAALMLSSCSRTETGLDSDSDGHTAHWGYEADNGPDAWGSMSSEWALCTEGREQSPIDLTNATETELPAVNIDTPSEQEVEVLNQAGVIHELDNGDTIQINAKTGEKLIVGDQSYALVQFHFHAPSEHTVDGERFPMEMHFVHQAEDGALPVVTSGSRSAKFAKRKSYPAMASACVSLFCRPSASTFALIGVDRRTVTPSTYQLERLFDANSATAPAPHAETSPLIQ